jgi:hypothetical protein
MRSKVEQFQSLSRRLLLQAMAAAVGATGFLALGGNPAAAQRKKKTKKEVAYQPTPKGSERCDNCGLFIKPNRCKSVVGTVAPEGWCKIWTE